MPVNFHGDLHFENIIANKNKFTLLDWREDFSGLKTTEICTHDLAKINHGLIIDHNVISQSKFKINVEGLKIKFSFFRSKTNMECQKFF